MVLDEFGTTVFQFARFCIFTWNRINYKMKSVHAEPEEFTFMALSNLGAISVQNET
jgi:hypothetical protein